MDLICNIKINGRLILFFKDKNGEIDFRFEHPVPDEEFSEILEKIIEQGILDRLEKDNEINQILEEIDRQVSPRGTSI